MGIKDVAPRGLHTVDIRNDVRCTALVPAFRCPDTLLELSSKPQPSLNPFFFLFFLCLYYPSPLKRFGASLTPAQYGCWARQCSGRDHRQAPSSFACFCFVLGHSWVSITSNFLNQSHNSSIVWLLSWAKSLVAFATITVPRWLYAIVSYSMTLTVRLFPFCIRQYCSMHYVEL